MAMPSTDTDELAKFGYKQELDRSLGLFSSFAAGFSYISIMTGVFELFFFGFGSGGPAFIWTWPAVFIGQMLVALCFAELAGQYPLAGSVYQWSKQIARPFTSFFGGCILTVGSIVTLAAVAVAYQVVLLVLNVGNQRAFFVLTSVAIIMFYLAYLCVTGPLLVARLRGRWPSPDHGPYFSLGRWGLLVNLVAVVFQIVVLVNLAWPRPAVYGADKWYFQWGAFTFTGVLGGVGVIYYLIKHHGRPATVLAEHRATDTVTMIGGGHEPV